MTMFKRILRIALYTLLVLVVAVVGALVVLTKTERGRANLAGIISTMASTDDRKVTVSGIDGIWSGALTVDHVVLEDRQGPWLVARKVAVDWSPLALLSKNFSAGRIGADRIELARLPVAGTQPSQGGATTLPVSLDIKQIDLPEIALGQALAGSGIAELAAKGSFKADAAPLALETSLNITRHDGKQGKVDANIHFAPADNKLDLDLKASEPAGGIIANLLKLPDAPPVNIVVTGTGPVANWSGIGTFVVDGQIVTQLTGRHQLTDKGNCVEANGDGEFERFLPETLQSLFAGKTSFDLAGTATAAGGIDVERANIDSDAVHATAAGKVDPNGASDLSVKLAAKGPPIVLSLGSTVHPITAAIKDATARAFGDGKAPMVDIGASLVSVVAGGTRVDDLIGQVHSDGFDIQNRSGPVTIKLTAAGLNTDVATLAPLVTGRVCAGLAGSVSKDQVVVDEGTLRSDALNASVTATVALADLSMTLKMNADAASTALPSQISSVLGQRVQFSATATRDTDGAFAANALQLTSGTLSASGTASAQGTDVRADIKGTLGDVSVLSPLVGAKVGGAVGFALTASGARSAPDFSVSANSDSLTASGHAVKQIKLSASGKADIASPAADVSLTGSVDDQPLDLKASLVTTDGKRSINGLAVSLADNRVSGDLGLDDNLLPLGTLTLDAADIAPLARLAGQTVAGDVRGTIRFANDDGAPTVAIDATSGSISRGDLAVKTIAVNALVANYLAAPVISGQIRADSVTSDGTAIRGVNVDLKRDGEWTGFSGGASVKDIPLKAAGRVRIANGTTTVELTSGEATMRGIKAAIAHASTITIAKGVTSLDRLVLNLGGGTATVTAKAGQALDLNATLARVPISIANRFSPGLDAADSISGTVKVTGAPANPAVAFKIDTQGVQTSQTRGAGFGGMGVSSSGTCAGNRLTFDANMSDAAGLGLKGGGTMMTSGAPTLDLNFFGKVPFAFLTRTLAAQGLSLSGTADVNLKVRGPATSPVITGTVRTSGARLIDARSGLAINDITADVAIGGGVARINRLTGNLSTRGSLSASGTVGINPAQGFPADLSVKLVDGRYTDGRVVTANLSGDLTIKGPLASAPVISGTINLAKTVITVPEKLPGSLAELNVKHKNAPAAVRAQDKALRPAAASSGGGGSGLNLDVTVNAPSQIFIQGRGVDAELGGSLRLTGPASSPQAVGTFTLQRGRLTILAKRLTFTEGTVGFSGSLVPYLNLTATSTTSSATVTIVVSGEATNPKFNFSSVPALPEDEVLAQLIFGRSMSNLSPLQIAQLAEAAAQLAGIGGSTSLLQNLRSAIGIDDLEVITDEEGGTAVSAGKYLNDRTYVTIQKGDRPGSGKATVDLDVGRGVKLRGETTDAGEAKGGVFYEREY
ncbi:translocation/assembly module TamB domain-containing protein [Mesorhizobium sp.]|uniref:translocation/assembly module TamB domain-containing protein n=3 Tax=Mesorhizobium sp. TaxID=1871066 RepID=UPI000FE6083E|nr:translocation/assembly module TamB domain-containing protein [Mesorhizobium sp.]RWM49106.1 MAG: translocation/assembly module TamB [Mesorhizobium sp.]